MSVSNYYSVVAVTVTYGSRKKLLQKVLDNLVTLGLNRIIVVDNGANWNVKSELQDKYDNFIETVELKKNSGSAHGFFTGIRQALASNADYIWLLDDDLLPSAGSLEKIINEHKNISATNSPDKFAVLASRPDYVNLIKARGNICKLYPKNNTFLEFSAWDIPNKIYNRTGFFKSKGKAQKIESIFLMRRSPYGGLFFHRSVIDKIGYPNIDFGLYVDDYEYTERLSNCGGGVYLLVDATLNELEKSWNSSINKKSPTSFENWLTGPDFRVYYTIRNMVYLETHRISFAKSIYCINKYIYLTVLIGFAFGMWKLSRLSLIFNAIAKGEKGELGLDPRYPLPNPLFEMQDSC